jgi:hypothetical protein
MTEKERTIPYEMKIGRVIYTISLDKDDYLDAGGLLGEVDYASLTIFVKSDIPTVRQQQVLLHEAAHAMLYELGYEQYNEENLIRPLEMGLYQILSDNDFTFLYQKRGVNNAE